MNWKISKILNSQVFQLKATQHKMFRKDNTFFYFTLKMDIKY